MPDTVTLRPAIPTWLDPNQRSVISPWWQNAVRTLAGLAGVNDPASQVMTGVAPMAAIAPEAKTLGELAGIKAYHGSPHDFERFDLSKIGTGEGAQAYGHGLYFAENPQTAQAYREILSNPTVTLNGQPVRPVTQTGDMALAHLETAATAAGNDNKFDLARRLIRQSQSVATPDRRPLYDDAINEVNRLEQAGAKVGTAGRTYEVAIKAHPDEFLDWDKPLSQQSESIKQAISKAYGKDWTKLDPSAPGSSLYRLVGYGDSEAGTAALKSAGVKGIRYLDQASRSAGEGTRNFVVFDDSLIDIIKKYGVAPPIAAKILQQQQAQQKGETVR